jgi:hypothetical protein
MNRLFVAWYGSPRQGRNAVNANGNAMPQMKTAPMRVPFHGLVVGRQPAPNDR